MLSKTKTVGHEMCLV